MATNRKALIYLGALILAAIGYASFNAPFAADTPRVDTVPDAQKPAFPGMAEDRSVPAATQTASQHSEIARLKRENSEIPRLRAKIASLTEKALPVAQVPPKNETEPAENAFETAVIELASRAAELNRHMQNMPSLDIPELQLLEEADWLSAAKGADFDTQEGIRKALSKVRQKAKTQFAELATAAFNDYYAATKGSIPTDPSQLLPYFKTPIDPTLLQRYQLVPSSTVQSLMEIGPVLLSEKAPVDREYDTHFYIGRKGVASFALGPTGSNDPDTNWANR